MTKGTAGNPDIRIPWAGRPISLDEFEDQLAFLWKMSADNMRTGSNLYVRTSVLNLLICAPDIETARKASALLRYLSTTHLARVTILILDRSTPIDALSAWVTLRCFSIISDLMRHCFEQTTLLLSGSALRSAANIVRPLLKPDLPAYLWWIGEPASNDTVFKGLVEISNRVIIDTSTFLNPEEDLLALSSLMQSHQGIAISDMNWERIMPWRQLVAQFFDTPELLPYLSGIHTIEIEHAVAPLAIPLQSERGEISPNPTSAFLLAGWLKGRLGLQRSFSEKEIRERESGHYRWQLERTLAVNPTALLSDMPRSGKKTQNTSLELIPRVYPELRPGSPVRVTLKSKIESKAATFTINRENDTEHVLTTIELSQETRPQRTVSLASNQEESDLLQTELEFTGRDYTFEETLRELADLLG
ncbi:MAG TPA: glucose-6-phosphate dehydrogenase assembly protein OpcA [Ktedonobacteraceae bacterium]|nr:glucose-6-phosphate dehydrogenase assembly protein OpcA [Ktedonobacteraceae bacterium]